MFRSYPLSSTLTDTFLTPCCICIEPELEGGSRRPVEVERTLPPPFSFHFLFFSFSPPFSLFTATSYLYFLVLFCCTFLFYPFVASTFFIITSLFLFLALDISSKYRSPALCCTAILFFPALFLSCRSFKFFSLFLCGPRG